MKHKFNVGTWSLLLLCSCAAGADSGFTLIDYPNASSTQAWGINSRGDIPGYYTDADNNTHGFLMNGGHFTAIDYPGAAVTLVNGINPQGVMVGQFSATATSPYRGFILEADGVYTAFDYPSATTTTLVGINASGQIAGQYTLADGNRHTFLLASGRITKIDYPGATQTGPIGISPEGEVVGAYMTNGVAHGFVYSTGGGFTTVDYPNSTYTNITGRNASGVIVGRYMDSASVSHGYLLSNGQFTNVDYPGASFTGLTAIDPAGNITGRCTVNGLTHGFLIPTSQPPLRYTISDLGMVGPSPGQPIIITNNRLVVGAVVTESSLLQAVTWSSDGFMTYLGSAALNSFGWGINDRGVAVGQTEIAAIDPGGEDFCGVRALGLLATGDTCAPFATENGTMRPLGTLGGANGAAYNVNAGGQIAGTAENTTLDPACPSPQKYEFEPVLWQGEQVVELPTAGGDRNGLAYSINAKGDIVGASGSCAGFNPNTLLHLQPLHALLWQTGSVIDLGNLGGTGQIMGHFAHVISNNDEVVGWSDVSGNQAVHAFRWTKIGAMEDLGTLTGDGNSVGLGINDAGVITGISIAPDFSTLRAFVWSGGTMTDLNQLVPANSALYLLTACSINARGEITGFAVDSTGNLHGYLALPVDASESDFEKGVSPSVLSEAARDRMRSVGLGLAPGNIRRPD